MASYKQPCIHCGKLIESDAAFCQFCASASPFGYACPSCLQRVERGQRLCSSCGRELFVICPVCGGRTFADERCDVCGAPLTVVCQNKRCGAKQFFDLKTCTACGKKMKKIR